jgi:hypothetical protein
MSELSEVREETGTAAVGRSFELACDGFARIPALAGETLPQVYSFLRKRGAAPAGPEVFEYRFLDSPHGPEKPEVVRFTLTIAVPVAEPLTALPAPLEAVTLGAFRSVEIVTNSFGDEWRRVRDLAEAAGHERTTVEREVYHAWHGEGHPDTRVALQIGVR